MKKYLVIAGLVVIAGLAIVATRHFSSSTQPVACTMEAKMCPDGSSVGRTGPSCEFAQCPTSNPVIVPTPVSQVASGLLVGNIVISPTCPVESVPPDPKCAPKPFSPTVRITGNGSSIQVHASSEGTIHVPLRAGTYTVTPQVDGLYPNCPSQTVTITNNTTTTITISCDSGIR